MKRIIALVLILSASVFMSDICSAQIFRKDVFISYENLNTDAAYKQFLKARKMNQSEILTHLVDQAEAEYKKCETIDDLYSVKENLEIIKFWMSHADQKFIAITTRVRTLDRKVDDTIAEVKNQTVIQLQGSSTGYGGWGQELD